MATAVFVPVEEYLRSIYHPDCDYVDGEVVERNLGEKPHSTTQLRIGSYLLTRYPHLESMTEQRVQVLPTRFRIPDVSVLREDAPDENIIRTAPLLCVEVLSKDDFMRQIMNRIGEYLSMGVEVCWIVDPVARRGWTVTEPGIAVLSEDGVLRARGIEMPLEDVLPRVKR